MKLPRPLSPRSSLCTLAVLLLAVGGSWAGDNFVSSDANTTGAKAASVTFRSSDNAGVQTPHVIVDGGTAIVSTVSNDPAPVSVATTSTTALAANASRLHATLTNDGATKCYLSFGTAQAAGRGIPLYPNGGSYGIDSTNLYTGAIYVITASGTTTLAIHEGQ